MFKTLRIIFCILAVLCAAATVFIFIYFKWWGAIPLCGAVIFGVLMYICKREQESREKAANPPPAEGDFITGRVKKDDN